MLGRTCLSVENDGWAHCVRAAQRKPLPDGCRFEFFLDEGAQAVTESPNGEPVTWMTAGELLALPLVTPDDNEVVTPLPLTQAAIAYLQSLPPESPVILYFGG